MFKKVVDLQGSEAPAGPSGPSLCGSERRFARPRSTFSTLRLLSAPTQRDGLPFHRGARPHAPVL